VQMMALDWGYVDEVRDSVRYMENSRSSWEKRIQEEVKLNAVRAVSTECGAKPSRCTACSVASPPVTLGSFPFKISARMKLARCSAMCRV
jgi:hypothetical protein